MYANEDYEKGMALYKSGDHVSAVPFFESAADKNDIPAMYMLAKCLCAGVGVQKDYELGGSILCKIAVRHYVEKSDGIVIPDYLEDAYTNALKLLEMFAGQSQPWAVYYMGEYYYKTDRERSLKYYYKAAESGYAPAQEVMGRQYYFYNEHSILDVKSFEQENGRDGSEQSLKNKGYEYLTKSAEQNYAPAQHELSLFYLRGEIVEKDEKKAFELVEKSARQGYKWAEIHIAKLYLNGEIIEKNQEQAISWCKKAAEHGVNEAHDMLGTFYYNGDGMEKDNAKAAVHFEKAAEIRTGDYSNTKHAEYMLGIMYYNGEGVEKNKEKAFGWFKKCCEWRSGYEIRDINRINGIYMLGMCCINGEGTEKDKKAGEKYIIDAARLKHENAVKYCRENGLDYCEK